MAFFKIVNSQKFFVKISQIVLWYRRIDWCQGHWCSSTYMVVRLSEIRAKRGKKMCFLRFLAKHSRNLFENWRFWKRPFWKIGHCEKSAILNFFLQNKTKDCFILMKISPNWYGRMDGSNIWCLPCFSANSLLCII